MSTLLRPVLFTIGHSQHTATQVIDILEAAAVDCVVDVRRIPRSRANPQFDLDVLPRTFAAAGLVYVHSPALGGRRARCHAVAESVNAGWTHRAFHNYADYATTAPFQRGLDDLLALTLQHTCAIMCAEAVWWRCHRRIIADHVLARGIAVVHLFTGSRHDRASMTPFAVVGDGGHVSYPAPPAGEQPSR